MQTIKKRIISDLTGKDITNNKYSIWKKTFPKEQIIHIYKEFWFGSPFDTGVIDFHSTLGELEQYLLKRVWPPEFQWFNRTHLNTWYCYIDGTPLIMTDKVLKEFKGYELKRIFDDLDENYIEFWIQDDKWVYSVQFWKSVIGDLFEDYIKYPEEEYEVDGEENPFDTYIEKNMLGKEVENDDIFGKYLDKNNLRK